jgi:hypothetical protein
MDARCKIAHSRLLQSNDLAQQSAKKQVSGKPVKRIRGGMSAPGFDFVLYALSNEAMRRMPAHRLGTCCEALWRTNFFSIAGNGMIAGSPDQ